MADHQLKPCPFCESEFPPVASQDRQGHIVICTGCSALGPTRSTAADAIAAWNRRPAPAPLDPSPTSNVRPLFDLGAIREVPILGTVS